MMKRLLVLALLLSLAAGLPPAPAHAQGAATACASEVLVLAGDTLSGIAVRYLGSMGAYTRIVAATNAAAGVDASFSRIDNPNAIAVGMKLCIPAAGEAVEPAAGPVAPAAAPSASAPAAAAPAPLPQTITPPVRAADWRPSTAPHELQITQMREVAYPGSEIVVEETLAAGSNYSRYLVSYRSEGNKIYALLTIPQGQRPATGWPVVIFNHGYIPPQQYRTTERYVAYVDGFARSGYIVLRSDYRGHGFSEGEAEGGYGSPAYTVDVLNAVAAIKAHPDADPNRIGMWGHSMGGQVTLRSMVVTGDIKAGVIWAGVIASYPDLLNNWRRRVPFTPPPSMNPNRRRWREELVQEYGAPEENPAFWRTISPNSYLDDLSGPIQLHHGTSDDSVPFEFSEMLKAEMDAAGQTVELFIYPNDDHNLSGYFSTAMQRSIDFFDRYVKNAPPAANG